MPSRDQAVSLYPSLSAYSRFIVSVHSRRVCACSKHSASSNKHVNQSQRQLRGEKKGRRESTRRRQETGSIIPSLLFLSLLYLFNVFWVNIRQEEGGTAVILSLPSPEESSLFLASHLILTEATTITICHPFDSFCHQLAAKSASPQTGKRSNLYVYYLALV